MTKPNIICVIPTVRPTQYKSFIEAWKQLFIKHDVTLVTVWDGETPKVDIYNYTTGKPVEVEYNQTLYSTHKELIYRYTDACRNLGFIVAAHLMKSPDDVLLTLDDDVAPLKGELIDDRPHITPYREFRDPIQDHLDVLNKKVPLGWMNTAHDTELYLRGVPYNIRSEAPVMLSHGVWVGTPDFDGETQLRLEGGFEGQGQLGHKPVGIPYSLPYYVGPIPKGVLFPLCGMNVAIKRDALPYLYFAPMGVDTKIENLNRFADIWMGIYLKKEFDRLGWGCYTGGSTILHTRASDAKKNFEQEKLGREWNEDIWKRVKSVMDNECLYESNFRGTPLDNYLEVYHEKRSKFTDLITAILLKK